jgi:hypothetical protein
LCFRLAFWPNIHEPVTLNADTPEEAVKELYRKFPEGFKLKYFDVGTNDPVVVSSGKGVTVPYSVVKAASRFFSLIVSGWHGEGDPPPEEEPRRAEPEEDIE